MRAHVRRECEKECENNGGLTIAIYGAMGARLLAVAFDFLSAALIAGSVNTLHSLSGQAGTYHARVTRLRFCIGPVAVLCGCSSPSSLIGDVWSSRSGASSNCAAASRAASVGWTSTAGEGEASIVWHAVGHRRRGEAQAKKNSISFVGWLD